MQAEDVVEHVVYPQSVPAGERFARGLLVADPGERLGGEEQQLGGAALAADCVRTRLPLRDLLQHRRCGRRPVQPRVPEREVTVEHDPLMFVRLVRRLETPKRVTRSTAL